MKLIDVTRQFNTEDESRFDRNRWNENSPLDWCERRQS
jgi:hypothetical protein